MKKKVWIIIGALFVAVVALAGILYLAFPIAMTTYGGMGLNYLKTLSTPAGTVSTEANPAYVAPAAAVPSILVADAAWPNAAAGDWPSYNRTPSSQRFSPLTQINTKNVGQLKVLCTYSTHQLTSFETALIMVEGSLIGTTEFDIFSLDPATCAEKWRTHFDGGGSLLVQPRNPGEVADRLQQLLDSPERRLAMGLANRARYLKHFSVEQYRRNLEDALKRVIR